MSRLLLMVDVGGVLHYGFLPLLYQNIAAQAGTSVESVRVVFQRHLRRHNTGLIGEREFLDLLSRELCPGKLLEENLLTDIVSTSLVIRRDIKTVIGGLSRRDRRVVAVTNSIPSHVKVLGVMGVYDDVDEVYASFAVGVAKPNTEFFRRVMRCERYHANLLIDDTSETIEAARELGIHGLHLGENSTGELLENWLEVKRRELCPSYS